MTWETAKAAVDYLREHSVDSDMVSISFYGGEPLLAFDLIKQVVEYADELFDGKELIYGMTTNATLITDEIARFIKQHQIRIMFSIDGPRDVQNKNRVFRDGRGSYDTVEKNVERPYHVEPEPDSIEMGSINTVISPDEDYCDLLQLFDNPIFNSLSFQCSFVEQDNEG